jgi:hypothetical protein
MSYTVITGGFTSSGSPAPAAIHQPSFDTSEEALDYTLDLIAQGETHIQISDGSGHAVSGEELVACLKGQKKIADFFPQDSN